MLKSIAPAKINLSLNVTGRRLDGYHLLESIVVFANFGDEISIAKGEKITLDIVGEFSEDLENDSNNLVIKAANLLADFSKIKNGASIKLVKNLPVSGGIGGGSSDAATTLLLLNDFWKSRLSLEELSGIAIKLGADVPVCLRKCATFISGIGENILVMKNFPKINAVLVNPGKVLSTKKVFEMGLQYSEKMGVTFLETSYLDFENLITFLIEKTSNDMTENACKLVPEIKEVLSALKNSEGCLYERMSGSGATCFAVFPNEKTANAAAQHIALQHSNWWIQTVTLS